MFKTLCILLVVLLCSCAKHPQSNTFIEKPVEVPQRTEIKTYTYKEALNLAEDSDGFYNFFLLPGIDPDQAYAFEEKYAEKAGFGYNVYTGAHPHTVETLVYVDISTELLEAYIETITAHIQAEKAAKYDTFRTAITYYMMLRKSMHIQMTEKKKSLYFHAEAERVLLGMLMRLVDAPTSTGHRVNHAWRTLDRVKFHMYRKKNKLY